MRSPSNLPPHIESRLNSVRGTDFSIKEIFREDLVESQNNLSSIHQEDKSGFDASIMNNY